MENAQDLSETELVDIDYTKSVRYARVVKVYDADNIAEQSKYGKVDLVWVDTNARVNGSVSFITPNYSPNYGCGIIAFPMVGDIAACYTLPAAPPVILGFLPRRIEKSISSPKNNLGQTAHMRKLRAGEVLIKSKAQTELYLSNDGNVTVSVRDGNNSTPVLNKDPQYTTVDMFNTVSCEESNTVVELELGKTSRMVGPGIQVASLCGGSYFQQECVVATTKGGFTYPLGSFYDFDVCDVESVGLYQNNTRVKSLDRNSVSLIKSYSYITGIDDQYAAGQNACSVDANTCLPSIVLPRTVAGVLGGKTTLKVVLLLRKNAFSLRANHFGDIFLSCRNFVAKTARNTAALGLFETDSRAVLHGAHVDIGDKLNGAIVTGKDGVSISHGVSMQNNDETKSEDVKQQESIIRAKTPNELFTHARYYFYILDDLPLFYYDYSDKDNPYKIAEISDYNELTLLEKLRIVSHTFDTAEGGFTEELMYELIKKRTEDGSTYTSYAEMKSV